MNEIVRFQLPEEAAREEVEEDVGLALFVAECLHGRPSARLDASYLVNPSGRRCVLAVRGEAGDTAVRVVVGLFNERYGEDGFQVERVGREGAA